jgi:hypothetical protein
MEVDIPVDAPQVRERPEKSNRNRKHAVPERVEEHQRTLCKTKGSPSEIRKGCFQHYNPPGIERY